MGSILLASYAPPWRGVEARVVCIPVMKPPTELKEAGGGAAGGRLLRHKPDFPQLFDPLDFPYSLNSSSSPLLSPEARREERVGGGGGSGSIQRREEERRCSGSDQQQDEAAYRLPTSLPSALRLSGNRR
ncbi:hypothetical protein FQA47_025618 [Oryzias melastigma]|uniref:Uncharacterized protein n=1 Tax=Oryzias melastigma TaxID=30732 RepID=A0A834CJH9_ORYME|nr:hypothetical protein FQA47_025618 [Oryzias melastigma]